MSGTYLSWSDKDPDETDDFSIDYSLRLNTDETISTSTWTVPSGLTLLLSSISGGSVIARISGGTAGEDYAVANYIITSGGRRLDQTVYLGVKPR